MLIDSEKSFRIRTSNSNVSVSIFPPPNQVVMTSGAAIRGQQDGLFTKYNLVVDTNIEPSITVSYELVQAEGPARKVPIGPAGVAMAPNEEGHFGNDTTWDNAAVYRVYLAAKPWRTPMIHNSLRVRYLGDCARVYVNGTLVQDSFYNGDENFGMVIGVNRYEPIIFDSGFELRILPLRADAPIYVVWPSFPEPGPGQSVVELLGIDTLQTVDNTLIVN